MISNRLKWIYLAGFFLILALPLLNIEPWFSPPNWGKTIVFRIVLSLLIFLFLCLFLKSKEKPFVSKITRTCLYLLSAFLGAYFLATIFSVDSNFSLWGSPARSGGFINVALFIIFAVLAFFVLKKEDWPKIWNFSFIVGALVSIVAILQWQGVFEDVLITYANRPPSTIGNPIMLALYLLLLSFLALAFCLKERFLPKKLLYFLIFSLFFFVILLTYSRAAYLGLAVGLLYFFFFFPFQKRALSLTLKMSVLALLIAGSLGVYYINTTEELPEFIQENRTLRGMANRLSLETALQDPRISGWEISWQAIKDRPILGYGPENFAVGFDKHYDPATETRPGGADNWWDRAHNFAIEKAVTAGIPALILYLSVFVFLFWHLQKRKSLLAHSVQASFLAYLTANFFSIDNFATYLISFLLIGYSLHIVNNGESLPEQEPVSNKKKGRGYKKYRGPLKVFFFVLLVWFIWSFNLKPLQINKEINLAVYQAKTGNCNEAVKRMENVFSQKSILDGHLRLKYIEIINNCLSEEELKESRSLAERAREVLRENTEIMPRFTRNWLWLGRYNNLLAEHWYDQEPILYEEAVKEAESSLAKANQLSPKRQEVLQEWAKASILSGEYKEAEEKSKQCIELNENFAGCWWLAGLSRIYLNDLEKADEYLETAGKKGHRSKTQASLVELARAYIKTEEYERLVEVYLEMIRIFPDNPQNYAQLAFTYQELGEIKKARETALKIIELFPEHKAQTEEFILQLP